jgi:N-formylglutamate amidohydrolase
MFFQESFLSINENEAFSPIVISIPHAGRAYPQGITELLRVPLDRLMRLEDRYADLLARDCIGAGYRVLTAQYPRLWIDLNRAEADFDVTMVSGTFPASAHSSHKVRSGLGLVPKRLAGVGDIWRHKLAIDDLRHRIAHVHRPYHAAITAALLQTQRRFGSALLLDLHSMPPLSGADAAHIVIGDRFGQAADSRLSECARALCQRAGYRTALNAPYAGGYILERHGRPQGNVHAIQIEIDRSLYLDASLAEPHKSLEKIQNLVIQLADGLVHELTQTTLSEAAE